MENLTQLEKDILGALFKMTEEHWNSFVTVAEEYGIDDEGIDDLEAAVINLEKKFK